MRIIAGRYRGSRLHSPPGTAIRPTADRLRESIFNIIGPRLPAIRVLDLFAGTGAMGIEALSRGADHAVFVDRSPEALYLVRKNLAKVKADAMATVISWDIARDLQCLSGQKAFEFVFVDPPYRQGFIHRTLVNLKSTDVPLGTIVVEHALDESMADLPTGFVLKDQRRYGKTLVSFLAGVL